MHKYRLYCRNHLIIDGPLLFSHEAKCVDTPTKPGPIIGNGRRSLNCKLSSSYSDVCVDRVRPTQAIGEVSRDPAVAGSGTRVATHPTAAGSGRRVASHSTAANDPRKRPPPKPTRQLNRARPLIHAGRRSLSPLKPIKPARKSHGPTQAIGGFNWDSAVAGSGRRVASHPAVARSGRRVASHPAAAGSGRRLASHPTGGERRAEAPTAQTYTTAQ